MAEIDIPPEFSQREDAKAWVLLSLNLFVVVFGGVIAWHIHTWWAYAIAFVLVGARAQACYILQHETMHNLLFTRPQTNERVGIVLSAVLGTQFHLARKMHWDHHRNLGRTNDPNEFFHDVSDRPPGRKALVFFLSHLAGARLVNLCVNLLKAVLGRPSNRNSGTSRPVALPPAKARLDFVALFSTQLTLLIVISLLSSPLVYFGLFLIPLSTLTAFFELLRSFSEHALPGTPSCDAEQNRLFLMDASPVERFFISQFDFHYHHVHHLHVNVVTFKVRALHEWLLVNDPSYSSRYQTRPGFVGTAWRYLHNRPFTGAGVGYPYQNGGGL